MMNKIIFILIITASLFAAEYLDSENFVREALENTIKTPDSLFHHYRITRRNLEKLVEEYNPAEHQHWNLILIDGQTPRESDIKDFIKRKQSGRGQRQELNRMLDYSSLTLLEKNDSHSKYQFEPLFDEERLRNAPMLGELTIITENGKSWVKSIFIQNVEPLSPAPMVKFDAFQMTIEYTSDSSGEYILPARFTMKMQGKALGLKQIDIDFESLYGLYRTEGQPISISNDAHFQFLQ
ncbi:MAG TPA: hypothetical protein ENN84_11600 [Candidatus Marinimicrobia bacterium]|nr:hypothetical protein [Candidatus Neomarinimicrobiota bacterium]